MKKLFFLLLLSFAFTTSFAQGVQNIGGIGAQLILDTTDGYTMPRIFALVPNSPAYQALNATDYIIKVNDVSCKNKTIEEVVALIRGEAGSAVKITTAPAKDGVHAKDTLLLRVGMQIPGGSPPDPSAAFYEACENEVKQLKKGGAEVVKTFNSECGNYFFNFNADPGTYHVRLYTMEEKGKGAAPSFTASAKVFDGDKEPEAVQLAKSPASDKGTYTMAQLDGTITFRRSAVGVVSVTISNDAQKCRGMYIIVYK